MCKFFIQVHVLSSWTWYILRNWLSQWHAGTEENSENILLPASRLKLETSKYEPSVSFEALVAANTVVTVSWDATLCGLKKLC